MRSSPEDYMDYKRNNIPVVNPALKTARNFLYHMDSISSRWARFRWNEGLARAARHLVNDMGPCGTYGDANSDFLPEILSKYYAHSYDNLDFIEVRMNALGYEPYGDSEHKSLDASGDRVVEYLLSQECIDKSIFKTTTQLEMGIACNCAGDKDESYFERNYDMVCYIAVADSVEVKHIIERIPGYNVLHIDDIDGSTSCNVNCHQINGEGYL